MLNRTNARLTGLALLLALGPAAGAFGKMAPPAPLPIRLAVADAVVVGTVTKIEDKTVKVGTHPVEHQVAVVKVEQGLRGADGVTHVRIAFTQSKRQPGLAVDQEAMFFLAHVPGQSYYHVPDFYGVVDKKTPTFDAEVKRVARLAKLLAKPDDGLQSKDAQERYLTAVMLVTRYRAPREGATKQEPIDAAQSKRILEALAEQDWKAATADEFRTSPAQLFGALGLTDADGWTPPKGGENYEAKVRGWLKDNAGTYRVKKYVAEK